MNLSVSGCSNALNFDPLVDNRIVVHNVVVDDRRMVVNPSDLGRSQLAMAKVVMIKVS